MSPVTGASLAMVRPGRATSGDRSASRPAPSAARTARRVVAAGAATGASLTVLGAYGLGRPFSSGALECLRGTLSTRGVFTKEGLVVMAALSGISAAVFGLLVLLDRSGRA